jgi:hypothetical protein
VAQDTPSQDTPGHYRNPVLYEVYVRNHGPNGTYQDLLAPQAGPVRVRSGRMPLPESAAIVRYANQVDLRPVHSLLLEYRQEVEIPSPAEQTPDGDQPAPTL